MELQAFQDPLFGEQPEGGPLTDNQIAISQEEDICTQILLQCIFNNWLNQDAFCFEPILDTLCQLRGLTSIFQLL